MTKLVSAGAQHRAQHRLDAFERPAAAQRIVDLRIEPALLADDAADNVAEKGRFRRPVLRAFNLAAEPMVLELRQDFVQAGADEVHLIKRLHGGEPCCTALVRLPGLACRRARHGSLPREPMLETHERQCGSRGIAALVLLRYAGAGESLRLGVDGDDAVPDRQRARNR